jgi:hypothetical protein
MQVLVASLTAVRDAMLPIAPLDETASGPLRGSSDTKVTETCQNSLAHWATARFVWGVGENERIHFAKRNEGLRVAGHKSLKSL